MAENYLPETRVVMAIRLAEIIKQKNRKGSEVTISDLEKILTRLKKLDKGFDIPTNKLPKILMWQDDRNHIESMVVKNKDRLIRAYRVNPMLVPCYDKMLEELGIIERKTEIKIQQVYEIKL
jgi:hypothetical protein